MRSQNRPDYSNAPAALAAGLAGCVAPLGWAPHRWWPVTLVCYAVFFAAIRTSRSSWSAAGIGALFGFGLHLSGHGWMYGALRDHFHLGTATATLSMAIFLAYLVASVAVPCGVFGWLRSRRDRGACERAFADTLALAALLTFGEWARSLSYGGFSSLSAGYLWAGTVFNGLSPIGGVYLSSFFTYFAVFVCVAIGSTRSVAPPRQLSAVQTAGYAFVWLIFLAAITWEFGQRQWSIADGRPISYRLIQTDVAQVNKFDRPELDRQSQRLIDLVTAGRAAVIVTPETAFARFINDLPPDSLARLTDFSRKTASNVFVGIATSAASSDGFNSVVQISPDPGDLLPRYDKRTLTPFGEYRPIGLGFFADKLSTSLKDLSAGRFEQEPFRISSANAPMVTIGTLICQEDQTSSGARSWASRATLLLNPSNLAWFDGTPAIEQGLQIAQMRAAEVGRPLLRVANAGGTAAIDAQGRILARLPAGVETVLTGSVEPTVGDTPYARVGDALVLGLCLLSLAPVVFFAFQPRRKGDEVLAG